MQNTHPLQINKNGFTLISQLLKYLCKKMLWGWVLAYLWLQASFVEKQVDRGNFRITVNNLGMIGNSFKGSYLVQGFKSAEFPKGSNRLCRIDGGWRVIERR